MALEKATGLVIRTHDWSETSRICTVWTQEFGKVRALAKGGRRLKSAFEIALDLLAVCRIVLLRKSSSSLDLLTEAQVVQTFPHLRTNLSALYGGYYMAELLGALTEDYDPHPKLYEATLIALERLGRPPEMTGLTLARYETILLRELGYGPCLEECADCRQPNDWNQMAFSPGAGGAVCKSCRTKHTDWSPLSHAAWKSWKLLLSAGDDWQTVQDVQARKEIRRVLNDMMSFLMGRRPRLLPYLGS